MIHTKRATRGMVTSPHHLASQAGLAVLRDGGTAIEAAVAVAAALAVVYPHMNSIGGDSFWLLHHPGQPPVAVEGCGAAAQNANLEAYLGHTTVPWRGPLAANTVAGTLSAWDEVLRLNAEWGGSLPRERLLEDAIWWAREGVPVSSGYTNTITSKLDGLRDIHGFADVFLPNGQPHQPGEILKQPALARTLSVIARDGGESLYRGELARSVAADLATAGTLLTAEDLAAHQSRRRKPLSAHLSVGRLFNFPPPTQGLASLLILAIFDRLGVKKADSAEHIHAIVEATKRAFAVRDREIGDPRHMTMDPQTLLDDEIWIAQQAAEIKNGTLGSSLRPPSGGDTVWFGAIDREGRAASVIQSTYFEFGSGIVLPDSGITWQNRGASFKLAPSGWNALKPGRQPFHTLNPALAQFADGRVMVYGTMGGDGQPQTQAAIFSRYALLGQELQQAVSAPRWLLGRTWGEESSSLKIELRFGSEIIGQLTNLGHPVEIMPNYTDMMGHAGAIVWHPNCTFEGAADPRSDGSVAAY